MGVEEFEQAGRAFDDAQLKARAAITGDDEAELQRLADLSLLEYDRVRKDEAKRLRVKTSTLDQEVEARRPRPSTASKGRGSSGSGRSLVLPEVEPWPEPVDGAAITGELVSTIRRYVSLTDDAVRAVALWVVWSWQIDRFDIAPRLAVLSPVKQCGKTTLLELLSYLTPRSLLVSGITPSAIFRTIEAAKPTLLIDEADTFTKGNEELRGILNSGHTRASATIVRTVGDDFEPRMFSTWCPMVLAAIGSLPGTVEDRSIIIPMQRKAAGESVTPLPQSGKRAAALRTSLQTLAQKIKRWVADSGSALADADPAIPDGLHNRASDNWRPLLAIADAIGGEWPERARTAAVTLAVGVTSDSESVKVQLLRDIQDLQKEHGWDRIGSQALCEALVALEERPWSEWRKGKPISPAQLARMLRPFGVTSRNLKLPSGVVKGYSAEDLADSFARYLSSLPEFPLSKRYSATSRSQSGDESVFQSATEGAGSVSENGTNPAPDAAGSAVADQNGEVGGEENIFEKDHAAGSHHPAHQVPFL